MTPILLMNLIIACGLANHNSFFCSKLSLDKTILLPMRGSGGLSQPLSMTLPLNDG